MNKWNLVNVVVYDGVDAYVSKFVFRGEDEKQWRKDFYSMNYDEVALKFDCLYPVSLENILAFKEDNKTYHIYEKFESMYF